MRTLLSLLSNFSQAASPLRLLLVDTLHVLRLCLRSPTALAAENLFLRTQLALYQERQVKPRTRSVYENRDHAAACDC